MDYRQQFKQQQHRQRFPNREFVSNSHEAVYGLWSGFVVVFALFWISVHLSQRGQTDDLYSGAFMLKRVGLLRKVSASPFCF